MLDILRATPETKNIKIIMMTALNETKHVKKAFEMGCTVYSVKPIDLDKFKEIKDL